MALYWDIGRMIEARQQRGDRWGDVVAESLAKDLRAAFPGRSGFSRRNIYYMRRFFLAYQGDEKAQPLVAQIGWTKAVLIHQIETQSYEKTLLGQTNFDKTVSPAIRAQARLAFKDEYTFDFLELSDEHAERELERALVGRIERFLREMRSRRRATLQLFDQLQVGTGGRRAVAAALPTGGYFVSSTAGALQAAAGAAAGATLGGW